MKKMATLALILTLFAGVSQAKWWIFGKSNDDVEIKYLTINSVSAEESGKKITLFKDTLPEGKITVKGRAYAGKNQIGSVRISLDDKATWQDVKTADNGSFEYSFAPEQGKKYVLLIEATDTAGKVNKVDETRKELEVSAESIRAKITDTLDAMFEAYNKEEAQKFMSFVSENFAGDKTFLELAVKKDFDALSNINMRYTVNNIASGSGKIFISINFNRMVFVNKTGQSSTDNGMTEFVFEMDGGKPMLYSMKQPLVFGLSDAENIATGEVIGNTASNLVLDNTGSLGGGETVTIDCRGSGTVMKYTFATGAQVCDTNGGGANIWFYEWAADIGYDSSVIKHKSMGKSLATLTSAEVKNLSGYDSPGNVSGIYTGLAYCFYLSGSFYCVEPVNIPTTGDDLARFKVKQF